VDKIIAESNTFKKPAAVIMSMENFTECPAVASCTVWVRNLVSHFEGGTQTEGFWEQSVEEDTWT
jgi:hypothetical protein